jgi:hypothetical protein
MPAKPQTGAKGYDLGPLRELANSGTAFNYRAEITIRVPKTEITDEDADRIADALERRRRRRDG